MRRGILIFLASVISFNFSIAQIPYPGYSPGAAKVRTLPDNSVIMENQVIGMRFANNGKTIKIGGFEDKQSREQLNTDNAALFKLTLPDNSSITSNEFILQSPPVISDIIPEPHSTTYANRLGGKKYAAVLENGKLGMQVHWEAYLRDSANYVRQIFKIKVKRRVNISRITMIELPSGTGLVKMGSVDGSPIVHRNMFFAIEHPMSQAELSKTSMAVSLLELTPVGSGDSMTISTVWGTAPEGQLRRGFLYYLEFERSCSYRQMLHYNSWYDISWDNRKFNENQALDRIKMFRDSLIIKRRIPMNAFLFDDGWDDNRTLWHFNAAGFPDGFDKLKEATDACGSGLGVWLSPFGGYGAAKEKRIEYGNNQNPPFETNANGFSLAGPVYYRRFLDVTGNFIKKYNISIFKFDGVGPGNDASGAGIAYHNDIEAFLRLLKELKMMKPDLYLDLTTGTWPSAFWLMYGDNIWRSGDDNGQAGEGSLRQRGITYRDANTYKNVVKTGPLYPLNALMNGGIIIADNGLPGRFEMDDKDISDDIWSFFGTGVSLQELYINPHKLKPVSWDCLAEAVSWSRENEGVFRDVHWVGGDPAKGAVYGYAAWSPGKAILMLRNPSGKVKTFEIDVARIFELPPGVKNDYSFFDARIGSRQSLPQNKIFQVTLQPFEVKILNALPAY